MNQPRDALHVRLDQEYSDMSDDLAREPSFEVLKLASGIHNTCHPR